MVLATPAVFDEGWRPGWLDERTDDGWAGTPPGADVRLRLVGACVDRWKPISGWSYEDWGPKPIQRMAPAGSVYFFKVKSGEAHTLADSMWLRPVSDDPERRRSGFGLALWGVWEGLPGTSGNSGTEQGGTR